MLLTWLKNQSTSRCESAVKLLPVVFAVTAEETEEEADATIVDEDREEANVIMVDGAVSVCAIGHGHTGGQLGGTPDTGQ